MVFFVSYFTFIYISSHVFNIYLLTRVRMLEYMSYSTNYPLHQCACMHLHILLYWYIRLEASLSFTIYRLNNISKLQLYISLF